MTVRTDADRPECVSRGAAASSGGGRGRYPCPTPTLVLDPPPPELRQLLARRRRSGLDRLDEVWKGVLHIIAAPGHAHARIAQQLAELLGPPAREAGLEATMHEFNLGDSDHDFRVPDGGLHRPGAAELGPAELAQRIEWP
jgi:hypothetical protein